MATSPVPVALQKPRLLLAQIANADASNLKSLGTISADGTKIVSIVAVSEDTADRVVQLVVTRASVNYSLPAVTVKAGAGNDGATPAVSLLPNVLWPGMAQDADGAPYIFAQSADAVQAKSLTTVTSGKIIHIHGVAGDAS